MSLFAIILFCIYFRIVAFVDDAVNCNFDEAVFFNIFALEPYRDVIFAVSSCCAVGSDAFHEHLLWLAEHLFKIFSFVVSRNLSYDGTAFCFYLVGDLIWHDSSFGAFADGIFEGVYVAESYRLTHLCAFIEVVVAFTRKSYDEVSGDVEVGDGSFDPVAHFLKVISGIMSVHRLEGSLGAALEADVHVRS